MSFFFRIVNILAGLLIISYILPAGIIGGVAIQRGLVYLLLLAGIIIALKEQSLLKLFKQFRVEVVVIGAGVMWWAVSLMQGEPYSTRFFTLLYIAFFLFLAFVIFIHNDSLNIDLVFTCILAMIFGKIFEKIGIELLYLADMVQYDQIGRLYSSLFGTDVTTMTMDVGNLEFVRVQSSSDSIIFFLSPFFWFMPQIRKCVRGLLFVLTGVFAFIVFSRIFLVQFLSFAFLLLIYCWRRLSYKGKKVLILGTLLSTVVWMRPVVELAHFRFFSSYVSESDSIRMEQLSRFLEEIPQHLFWGNGMGSYLPDYIRSIQNPFSYELEYISYIYQLGIVGFIVIIGGMIYVYAKHIFQYLKENERIMWFITMLAALWFLVRPVFNPSFLGKQNGFVVLGVFLINVYCYKKKTTVS